MAANAQGTQCVRCADFALALPKRKHLFKSHGHQSSTLVGLEEIRLDERYLLTKTRWRMRFDGIQGVPIDIYADSTFILDTVTEPFKIVFSPGEQRPSQALERTDSCKSIILFSSGLRTGLPLVPLVTLGSEDAPGRVSSPQRQTAVCRDP